MSTLSIKQARDVLSKHAWKHPPDYGGYSPDGHYCILSQNRDSLLLDRHNYETAFEMLTDAALGNDKHVWDWRAHHWACGWVEYLMVAKDAPEAVQIAAAEIIDALSVYPILDEDGYSEAEYEAACEFWESMDLSERIDLLRQAGQNIFAARSDCLPDDDSGYIHESLVSGL
jgi:hypothetical protein|tara:strand:+ start:32 stop:547 length:516 start_codon:yes stop_codon:yes gene_type:complete